MVYEALVIPSRRASPAFVVGQAQKIIHFFFSLLTGVAVALLQLADKFFCVPLNLVDVIVGQFSPPRTNVSLYLKPFTFENIFIHNRPFACLWAMHLPYQLHTNLQWPGHTSARAAGTTNTGGTGNSIHKS